MAFKNPFQARSASSAPLNPNADALTAKDVSSAYDRGRRDALRGRKRHPGGMTFLFVAAGVGLAVLAYAAYSGSFSQGGARLDQDLAVAADRAQPMVRDAARDAGRALTTAGRPATTDAPAPPPPQ